MGDEPTAKAIRRNYASLLETREWRAYRREAIDHHGASCWLCGDEHPLQVHHLKYRPATLPWEYEMEEVRVYCQTCHETVTRCADEIWNECQTLMPHQLESILKTIKYREHRALAPNNDSTTEKP